MKQREEWVRSPWRIDGDVIDLITIDEFDSLEHGTILRCIDGKWVIKGHDHIDTDTRAGVIAYGFSRNLEHPDDVLDRIQKIVDEAV